MTEKYWAEFIRDAKRDFKLCRAQLRAPTGILPSDSKVLDTCAEFLNPQQLWQVKRHILACMLTGESKPEWLVRQLQNTLPKSFPPLVDLFACKWLAFPVLTRAGSEGDCVWLLFGMQENGTGKLLYLYDEQEPFNATAQKTVQLVRDKSQVISGKNNLYILPLIMNQAPLSGRSLALPAALAFDFLVRNQPWPDGLYATGDMDTEGNILPVAGIEEKFAVIKKRNPLLFLYPEQHVQLDETKSAPVQNFAQAVQNVQWFRYGVHGDFYFYHSCLTDRERFFDNANTLPPAVLKQAIAKNNLPFSVEDFKDLHFLRKAVKTLENAASDPRRGTCLQQIIPEEEISGIAAQSPDHKYQLFCWCSLCLTIANHNGNIVTAKQWRDQAEKLKENIGDKEIAQFINRSIINNRHNCYDFQIELPDEFNRHLDFFREHQQQYSADNYILGSLYGTKGQNYGFCGSDYARDALEMFTEAVKCFGRTYPDDRQRQYNYMAYINLDRGDYQKAAENIYSYLSLSNSSDLLALLQKSKGNPDYTFPSLAKKDSRFCWALLIRFLAETVTPKTVSKFWPICKKLADNIMGEQSPPHPWQLTTYNCGRIAMIAGNTEQAAKYWQYSGAVSCSSGDTTIRPMCLLAFSSMQAAEVSFEGSQAEQVLSRLEDHPQSSIKKHFSPLFKQPANQALRQIYKQPGQFFPFSYR